MSKEPFNLLDAESNFIEECIRRCERVRPDKQGIMLHCRYPYFITWCRINSYSKLAAWIEHLTNKTWWEKTDTPTLIRVVQDHFKWKRRIHL